MTREKFEDMLRVLQSTECTVGQFAEATLAIWLMLNNKPDWYTQEDRVKVSNALDAHRWRANMKSMRIPQEPFSIPFTTPR